MHKLIKLTLTYTDGLTKEEMFWNRMDAWEYMHKEGEYAVDFKIENIKKSGNEHK